MIKVLKKVDSILEYLSEHEAVAFGEIRTTTGLNKSTLSQILKSMSDLGWVERNGEGEFRSGGRLTGFAKKALGRESMRYAAQEASVWLAGKTGEMASASMLAGNRRVRLTKVFGDNEIRVDEEGFSGKPGGLLSTATGKVLLAFQSAEKRAEILESEDEEAIRRLEMELEDIRGTGTAKQTSPNGLVSSMARGIFDSSGEIAAAIGMSVSVRHCPEDKMRKYIADITEAAHMAEKLLKA